MGAEVRSPALVPHRALRDLLATGTWDGNPMVLQEDSERAHSRLRTVHLDDDSFVWSLEVREQFTVGSVRWGTVRLHGTWDGQLGMALEDLTGTFREGWS